MRKPYLVSYVLTNGSVAIQETYAKNFLEATINASTNIKHRPSLYGASIRKIEEQA